MRIELLACIMGLLLLFGAYTNCSAYHGVGSGNLSSMSVIGSTKCDPILVDGFKNYHHVLKSKCVSCHVPGGPGNGVFATPDIAVALPAFLKKGESKVFSFAKNPSHKPPYTGSETEALLQTPRQEFQSAMAKFETCNSNEGGAPNPTPPPPQPAAAIMTSPQMLEMNITQSTLTFDLNNGVVDPKNSILGASLTVKVVRFETATGASGFDVSEPRLTTGAAPVLVRNISFRVAGENLAGFSNVNRWVPANTTRLLQTGAIRFAVTSYPASFAIGFAELRSDANMVFTPATYNQLTAGSSQNGVTNVFALRCASCHSGGNPRAGISLTSADYLNLKLQGRFKPFDLQNSSIWTAVQSGSMPPNRPLPPDELEFIKGWILDGAPQN